MRVIQRLNSRQYVFLGTCRDYRPAKTHGQEIAVPVPQPDGSPARARRHLRFRCADIRIEDGTVETVVLYKPAGPGFESLPDWRIADRVSIENYGAETPPDISRPAGARPPLAPATLLGGLRRRIPRMLAILRMRDAMAGQGMMIAGAKAPSI